MHEGGGSCVSHGFERLTTSEDCVLAMEDLDLSLVPQLGQMLRIDSEIIFGVNGAVTGGDSSSITSSRELTLLKPLSGGAFSFSAWIKYTAGGSFTRIFEACASSNCQNRFLL